MNFCNISLSTEKLSAILNKCNNQVEAFISSQPSAFILIASVFNILTL